MSEPSPSGRFATPAANTHSTSNSEAVPVERKFQDADEILEAYVRHHIGDHHVDPHFRLGNILSRSLGETVKSEFQRAFGEAEVDTLPGYCREGEVRPLCHGECPKRRFIGTPTARRRRSCGPVLDQSAARKSNVRS